MGIDPPVSKVHLEQEVEPVGFNKAQVASEITGCTSAEEGGMEEPFEQEGHSLQAEEVLP